MKNALLIAATVTGLAAATPLHAGSFTLATGQVEPDTKGFDAATTANLRYGVEVFDIGLVEFDAEVEGATDISTGETANGRDYGFDSVGAALSARTAGPLYFIGRYGIARNRIDIDGGDRFTETQQSIGVGVGASIALTQFELMATHYPEEGAIDDVTWVTVGVRF